MGLRYEVLPIYHAQGDLDALRRLLGRYEEDNSAFFAYERLGLALVEAWSERVGEAGAALAGTGLGAKDALDLLSRAVTWGPAVEELARRAEEANPFVVFHLVGLGKGDPKAEHTSPGDQDEAAVYAALAQRWWRSTEPALLWLLARLMAMREEAETGRGKLSGLRGEASYDTACHYSGSILVREEAPACPDRTGEGTRNTPCAWVRSLRAGRQWCWSPASARWRTRPAPGRGR